MKKEKFKIVFVSVLFIQIGRITSASIWVNNNLPKVTLNGRLRVDH